MFRDESERQRAREAHAALCASNHERMGGTDLANCRSHAEWDFDATFPPIVDAPKWPEMSSGGVSGTMPPGTMAFNATPSPAFAAAVEAYALRCVERNTGYYTTDEMVEAARAALVRCHLEEVERGR